MAINFSRYVSIVSGVGGGAGVRQRDLIGRLFSTNDLIPTKSLIEFDNADDVGTYFGTTSEEYKRAAFYFGWISKNITKARKIAFARWADTATVPQLFGKVGNFSLNAFQAVTAGNITITMGADTNAVGPVDFSTATSLSDVASILQTAIRAESGTQFASAIVTYDAVRKSFNLEGSVAGVAPIAIEAGSTNDIANLLGWLSGAILSDGVAAESVTDALIESTDASNNFGSFLFMPQLSDAQVEEVAQWNNTQNVLFMYCVPVSAAKASSYYDALKGYQGVAVTLDTGPADEYPEMVPMIILAATYYSRRNSTQNYMFQQFNLTPSVTRTVDANVYDPLRVNYYGRTQTAGQYIDFYQRGVLMGLATNPTDMNTYANEQWLKDAAGAAIMELLLSLAKVSANTAGRAQLLATIQSVIDRALFNGTISVGKPLGNTQKQFITAQTGDPLAWVQVQNIGYWIDCVLQSYVTTDSRTEWKAVYTLIYSKDDVIRKVEGSHQLV